MMPKRSRQKNTRPFSFSQRKNQQPSISRHQWITLTLLASFLFCSAFLLVYLSFINREMTAQLETLHHKKQQLINTHSQLILEKSAIINQQSIQSIAKNTLHMVFPSKRQTKNIQSFAKPFKQKNETLA
jgi:cell division protein FtsL